MNFIDKIFTLSPYLELLFRYLYWNKYLNKFIKKYSLLQRPSIKNIGTFDIDVIFNTFSRNNIHNGSLIVLHTSYEILSKSGLSPIEIINRFVNYLGEDGTLAMNAARIFKKDELEDAEVYNVNSSRVWTGVLPAMMVKDTRSKISKFPINSMVAIGKLASRMMENNIKTDYLSSCGPYSSWNFCFENNADIIGIGIDLVHSLTMIHVAEETMDWPIKNWYIERNFKIIENNKITYLKIKDRNPKWGKKHFAERTLYNDLLSNNILKLIKINDLEIQIINSNSLINFLNTKNSKGYPYFFF
jgi:aminoglycoside 3-N-acetyltransferase